jgi:hypothetical protein
VRLGCAAALDKIFSNSADLKRAENFDIEIATFLAVYLHISLSANPSPLLSFSRQHISSETGFWLSLILLDKPLLKHSIVTEFLFYSCCFLNTSE